MPNFEEIYGKSLSEMDAGEKEIALFSYLERIDIHLEELNGKTKSVPWLERTTAILFPLLIAWMSWLTKCFFGK